ncbi:endonuclease domain-containing protein [Myxococcus stipitatus]|uniref:endonuclease domain-containing protein n=1 Tax=Myxococcus stipitatus TaxID=83455 RepID=UPI0030CC7F38
MLSAADTGLLDALDRHARRRAEGISTLSVLVGPPAKALRIWDEWLHRSGLKAASSESANLSGTVIAWASLLAQERHLPSDAEAFVVLSQRAFSPRELHFEGKTLHERRVLFERLEPPHGRSATWALCRQLLELPSAPGTLPTEVLEGITRMPVQALHALLSLIPKGRAPALQLHVTPSDPRSLLGATGLCIMAPSLHIACLLPPEVFAETHGLKESHGLAMLHEGLIEVPTLSLVTTGEALASEQPEPPLLDRFKQSAQAVLAERKKNEARARSKAERFLYNKVLQSHPATRGLFTLNATVDLGDGSRPLEVDFLCRELRIAVEIDGYHHFLEPERFRRDRRKDLALQRAGYWVARFLEEDVVPRYEEILKTLESLMAARRQEATTQRTPHGQS